MDTWTWFPPLIAPSINGTFIVGAGPSLFVQRGHTLKRRDTQITKIRSRLIKSLGYRGDSLKYCWKYFDFHRLRARERVPHEPPLYSTSNEVLMRLPKRCTLVPWRTQMRDRERITTFGTVMSRKRERERKEDEKRTNCVSTFVSVGCAVPG